MARTDAETVVLKTQGRYYSINAVSNFCTALGVATTINVYTGQYSTVDPQFNIRQLTLASEIVMAVSGFLATELQYQGLIRLLGFSGDGPRRPGWIQGIICLFMSVALLTVGAMNGNIWQRIGHQDDFLRVTPEGARLSGADAGIFKTLMVFQVLIGLNWLHAFGGIVKP